MKSFFITLGVTVFTFSLMVGTLRAQPVAFENVDVVSMEDNTVLENQTVLVVNDRIQQIAPSAEVDVPENASRINGSGRFLMPGLAEMHGHIPPPDSPREYIEHVLFLYVSAGITTVRGMLGAEGQLDLKKRINNGELTGPTLYLAGPSFSGNSIDSPDEARDRVYQQHEEGWDLLKVHPGLTREEYDAMADAAREVDMRFAGHVPEDVGLEHALEMGQETLDHLDGYISYMDAEENPISQEQLDKVVKLSLEHEVWVVPTQVLWETIIGASDLEEQRQYDELKYMPPNIVEDWIEATEDRMATGEERKTALQHAENRQKLLKALSDGGVPILMGTDAPQLFSVPGLSLYRELQKMSNAGMTPYEILKSGTKNVGLYFQNEDDFGTVAEGNRADLILVEENPLDNIRTIEKHLGVMVRGEWLPREEIDRQLTEIEESYR